MQYTSNSGTRGRLSAALRRSDPLLSRRCSEAALMPQHQTARAGAGRRQGEHRAGELQSGGCVMWGVSGTSEAIELLDHRSVARRPRASGLRPAMQNPPGPQLIFCSGPTEKFRHNSQRNFKNIPIFKNLKNILCPPLLMATRIFLKKSF
jgi:hypothetical protein